VIPFARWRSDLAIGDFHPSMGSDVLPRVGETDDEQRRGSLLMEYPENDQR
jgi:hypothetical protein